MFHQGLPMNNVFIRYVSSLIFFISMSFGQNAHYTKQPDGIVVNTFSEKIQLTVMGENIIRVVATHAQDSLAQKSLIILNSTPKNITWKLREKSGSVILLTPSIQVNVDISSGNIRFLDKTGTTILQESGREIIPSIVLGEKTNSICQKFLLSVNEALYGLGQHQEGDMNLRGKTVDLYQANMKVSMPMLVSTKGYGILWDNYSLSKFSDNVQGMKLWSEVGDGIDYYFIAGGSLDEVLSGYRTLTGQAPMFAKWAYGFFQSKERYHTQKEITSVVEEFRKRQVPLDVIIQDWHYWDPQKWGSHSFNRMRFPDPAQMNDEIHNHHAKILISVWAKFDSTSPNYSAMDQKGFLWKPLWETNQYYNAYNPDARELYWKQIQDSLFVKGFDGWWLDASEPDLGDLRNPEAKKIMNTGFGTGARYLNTYPLMTTTAVYQGQRKVTSDQRVYILTRSAFSGQQRNSTTIWSGDITASWDVFHKQIPAGINFCFTGMPYWTTDIGGYTVPVPGGYRNEMYRELFTRWYQYGTFCPIFRVHGSSTPREIWRFGDAGSTFYDTQLKFDHLRYRLLPYIYSLAWKVTHDHYTLMRGLAFDFMKDTAVYHIDDQFMFGPSILVNPVTEAMYFPWIKTDTGKIITSEHLMDINGKPGLTGEYYQGMNFDTLLAIRTDEKIDFDWGNNAPVKGMPVDEFSIRWKGYLTAPETGEYTFNTISDDGSRLFIDDQLVVDAWQDQAPLVTPGKIFLQAGKRYSVKLEYYENAMGAVAQLYWIKPSQHKTSAAHLPSKTRNVYLPGSSPWIDFWTGKTYSGGQTITVPAPIEIMPLYIRAGSLIPMGPFMQYSSEKPADPLELRIYPGADGTFTLYEDENDNYNYEKGIYSTISFTWHEARRTLTIGKREGLFPGMLEERTFHIILVAKDHGNDITIVQEPDKIIRYSGEKQTIYF
jgi:alpha-D-xyloside xylohydrolase